MGPDTAKPKNLAFYLILAIMGCMKKTAENQVFAVIATGGKQYLVSEGDVIRVEKIKGDYNVGDTVVFNEVVLVDDGSATSIGAPYLAGASVSGRITAMEKAKKVEVIKYKAKSNYFKRRGHRQPYFEVEILGVK